MTDLFTETRRIPATNFSGSHNSFPVKLDLSLVDADLWNHVSNDGGNIRVTNLANTATYPFDVVWIRPWDNSGILFFKADISDGVDFDFVVRVDDAATMPAPSATLGRENVWTEFLSVVCFPGWYDRTGNTTTQKIDPTFTSEFGSTEVLSDISANQGLAFDGTHWYTTGTNEIKKWTSGWTLVDTNSDPNGDTSIVGVNHCGDPCIVGGELFIPVEDYPNSPYDNQHICVFNTSDLSFNRSYDISAQGRESSSIALNPDDGYLYISDFTDNSSIPYYTTAGVYVGSLTLDANVQNFNGIEFARGKMYLSAGLSTATDNVVEFNLSGQEIGSRYTVPSGGTEGLAFDGESFFVLSDGTTNPIYRLDWDYDESEEDFSTGFVSLQGISTQGVWTLSATFEPSATLVANNTILGINRGGSTVERVAFNARQSSTPDTYSGWDNRNSWMPLSSNVVPTAGVKKRMYIAYNGTTQRVVGVDGVQVGSDSGIIARPEGTTMDFTVGARTSNGGDEAKGKISYAFFNQNFTSEEWQAAEYENLHTDTFTEVVGGGGTTVTSTGTLSSEASDIAATIGIGGSVTSTGVLASGAISFSATINLQRNVTSASLVAENNTATGIAEREVTVTSAGLVAEDSSVVGGAAAIVNVISASLTSGLASMSGLAERVITSSGTLLSGSASSSGISNITQNVTSTGSLASRIGRINASISINGEAAATSRPMSLEISIYGNQ